MDILISCLASSPSKQNEQGDLLLSSAPWEDFPSSLASIYVPERGCCPVAGHFCDPTQNSVILSVTLWCQPSLEGMTLGLHLTQKNEKIITCRLVFFISWGSYIFICFFLVLSRFGYGVTIFRAFLAGFNVWVLLFSKLPTNFLANNLQPILCNPMTIGHFTSISNKNSNKVYCDVLTPQITLIRYLTIPLIHLKILNKSMQGIILALDNVCGKCRRSPKAYFIFYTVAPQLSNGK